jgi:group I intron endonuclease
MKIKGIVYKATCIINNKVYIGQTIKTLNERKKGHMYASHKKSHYKFHRALRKYKSENFKWEIIDTANNYEDLNKKEEYYIKYYNSVDSGYNTFYTVSDRSFMQLDEYRKHKTKLRDNEASIIKYLYNKEKLTITEIMRLMNFDKSWKPVHNIVHDLSYTWVKEAVQIPYTREEIEKVKQESIEIQNIKNNNKLPQAVESKMKISTTSDETISYILWFLENIDMTSPELKELFNYSAMSKLRNGKTRTWVKPAKIVPIDILQKASQLREKRKSIVLENKVKDIKYIMNNKLMNQSQCARKFNVSQAFIWKVINNQTFDYVLPNDCYGGLSLF